jgi:hypothetical protein
MAACASSFVDEYLEENEHFCSRSDTSQETGSAVFVLLTTPDPVLSVMPESAADRFWE